MAEQSRSSIKHDADVEDLSKEFNPLPKLIVFDLDFTLWPFQVDKLKGPIREHLNESAIAAESRIYSLYPDVKDILAKVSNLSVLAVASRIEDIPSAYQMLEFFNISQLLPLKEIYPCSKAVHLRRLHFRSGVNFDDMLFFDDDIRSIRVANRIGVPAVQVIGGLTWKVLKDGLYFYVTKKLRQ